eukprot:TRINITY_DN5182_c0_g1_i1.p1 TRINITY_DN5182_c0_g1~~TRINITY_DN5182_c0_g1_i1.p1  ORF type:complete len:372 (+),score=91.32 TRINITY_DN5182_c0_g1_i1:598-1713(+)
MILSGLRDVGYEYINLDDCWQGNQRNSDGDLIADPNTFPHGIKWLANQIHSKGLKLGLYSDIGYKTCQGRAGSYNHFEQDSKRLAYWEVDFIKMDFCSTTLDEKLNPKTYYTQMSKALNASGRDIFFSICEWGWESPETWAPEISNMWRISQDIYPQWQRIMEILDYSKPLYKYAGPGHWNDPDMIEVGVKGNIFNIPWMPETELTKRESESHFSLWCMLSSPLILGNDLRNIPTWVNDIIANHEIIEVNQDSLGKQGRMVESITKGISLSGYCLIGKCTNIEIWTKELENGEYAVVLFNRGDPTTETSSSFTKENITITWKNLSKPAAIAFQIKDIWEHEVLGIYTSNFTAVDVEPHAVRMLRFIPVLRK